MRAPIRSATALFVFALAPVLDLHGQPDPESIPTELARALLGGAIWVGEAPPGIAEALALDGVGRIVGAVDRGGQSTVVVAVEGTVRDAAEAYRARLVAAGWTSPPDAEADRGGFVGTVRPGSQALCSAGRIVYLSPSRGHSRGLLHIGYAPRSGRDVCTLDAGRRPPRAGFPEAVPTLRPPSGSEVYGAGSGSGSDSFHSDAEIVPAPSPAALLEHYGLQLRAAGFAAEGESSADGLAASRWSFTDEDGSLWDALLVVWSSGDGAARAYLRGDRRDRPGR